MEKALEFLEFRTEMKKPVKTERGVVGIANKIKSLFRDSQKIEMLQASIDNEWQGLFPGYIIDSAKQKYECEADKIYVPSKTF